MNRDVLKHEAYLQMAALQSLLSKDPSTAVGAVLLDRNGVVKGTGYNGFARGVGDDPERYAKRATKLLLTRHAEENCLTVAGAAAQGGTLYSTFAPCARCAAAIVQAQVARVVYPPPANEFAQRWADDLHWATVQFSEAGVEVVTIPFDVPHFMATMKGQRGAFFPARRILVTKLTRTCDRFPTQFEGRTLDGKEVYIRYRHGNLTMVVNDDEVFAGDLWETVDDGTATYGEIKQALQNTAVLPNFAHSPNGTVIS